MKSCKQALMHCYFSGFDKNYKALKVTLRSCKKLRGSLNIPRNIVSLCSLFKWPEPVFVCDSNVSTISIAFIIQCVLCPINNYQVFIVSGFYI